MKSNDFMLASRYEKTLAERAYSKRVPLAEDSVKLWGFKRLKNYSELDENQRTDCNIYNIKPNDLDNMTSSPP